VCREENPIERKRIAHQLDVLRHLHVSVERHEDGGVDGAGHQRVGGGQQEGHDAREEGLQIPGDDVVPFLRRLGRGEEEDDVFDSFTVPFLARMGNVENGRKFR